MLVELRNRSDILQYSKGTHPRTQGLVKGKFIVGDLPPHLAQTELFSKSGEFPIAIRYSTEITDLGIDFNSYQRLILLMRRQPARFLRFALNIVG